jgi:hypothetical protein
MEGSIPPITLIVTYNLQQNGVVERKSRSIVETIKSMVHDLDLSVFLWEKACCTAIYVLNKCPHKVLKDKTPKETFTGEKPNISHFKVFKSLAYIHILDKKRTKLKPSNLKGILFGYSESSKAYKIYVPYQRKIVVSQDVKVEEDAWSSRSQNLPKVIEEETTFVAASVDHKFQGVHVQVRQVPI